MVRTRLMVARMKINKLIEVEVTGKVKKTPAAVVKRGRAVSPRKQKSKIEVKEREEVEQTQESRSSLTSVDPQPELDAVTIQVEAIEINHDIEEEETGPSFEQEFESKHVWDLIDCYFKDNHGLQSQAIESFNKFITESLPNIVLSCGKISVDDRRNHLSQFVHSMELTKVSFEDKVFSQTYGGTTFPLFPHEARTRNLNYTASLIVDIRHTIRIIDAVNYGAVITDKTYKDITIADIPIMVKSDFCRLHGLTEKELAEYFEDPDDPGGYFIINGKEKVIVTQEKPANNKLFLFKPMCDSKYQYECEVRSAADCATDRISALWIHIPGNPKSEFSFKDMKNGVRFNKISAGRSKSLNSQSTRNAVLQQFDKSRPGLVATVATVRGSIPLLILFKALGFESDKEVNETLLASCDDLDFYEALRTTMENREARKVQSDEEALYYIGYRSIRDHRRSDEVIAHGRKVISEEVLPSLGMDKDSDRIKGYHVGFMVNRLIFAYLGRIPCDNRDHLENKRFDLAGPMLASLFKTQLKSFMNEAKFAITRRIHRGLSYDIEKNIIRQKLITRGLVYAMTSGNWGDLRRGSTGRVGVSQLLNRLTGMATVSYLRRINSPVNRLVRMIAPRQIHNTAFGYLCPADTPEGETVGLLKSLSVMAEISADYGKYPIMRCLESLNYDSIEDYPDKLARNVRILLNSEIMGSCPSERVSSILAGLKKCRREYDNDKEKSQYSDSPNSDSLDYSGFSNKVSIAYHPQYKEIRIRTDAGRGFRPLLVVKNNRLVFRKAHLLRLLSPECPYGWKNLVQDGIIEYLDAAESETAMIAMFPSDLAKSKQTYITKNSNKPISYQVTYTHCEIHPSMILGVCASLIPYPDHNQSPRNTYQSGMAKQAIGVYQTNFFYRSDPEAHILHYPQRPLVTTRTSKFINYDANPAGINTITAICCYSGYNQEDSVILCKSAVERGLFRSTLYRTKTDEAARNKEYGDVDQTFEIPRQGEVGSFRSTYYAHLDIDGLPEAGEPIRNNDALIGKTQRIAKADLLKHGRNPPQKLDVSTIFRSPSSIEGSDSYIDSVILTSNPEGYRMARVKTRTARIPQIGDKFASRHGQKGVVGMDFAETDMPFTKEGVVPDIILNPHAIPSRMTIGHLLETVASKNCALKGVQSDGTCFTRRFTVDELGIQLEQLGYHKYGCEVMYNGATGRKIVSPVFIGPVYYQRLKHMTEDKIHVRSRGPVTAICQQPVPGMQRQGGLRFGEMERDATIAHGAAFFLNERLFQVSDRYEQRLCTECGNFLSKESSFNSHQGPDLNHRITRLKCRSCTKTTPGAVTIEIPYACKLFFQELMAMNIKAKIIPESDAKYAAAKKKPVKSKQDSIVSTIIAKMKMNDEDGEDMDYLCF